MKKKTLGFNALMNGLKNVTNIIFPLITFPYVSKVLEVDHLGKYNFAYSVISYFILFAALGISTYAIREGAKFRENKNKMKDFASQIFSINIFSMIFTYSILIVCLLVVPKFYAYRLLILVFSIEIIFRTIGVEWLLSIYEEYAFVSIRSFFVQFISLILVFLFVKQPDDLLKYAMITAFADAGSNILNVIKARKICKFNFTFKTNLKKHLKPILIIFGTSLATTIYVNFDTTLLGLMCNDHTVGLYSVSAKVYTIVKTFLSSILVVSIPRLSNYYGNKDIERYNNLFNDIFNVMLILVVPSMVGLFMLSKEVILILSSKSYLEAVLSLKILCFSLLVCMFGWLFNSCVLIPQKKEKDVFKATLVSAILNLVLNIILIPFFKQDAAAFTTFLSEVCSMIMCVYYSKDLVEVHISNKLVISVLIGCIYIIVSCILLRNVVTSAITYMIASIVLSVLGYFIILLFFNYKKIKFFNN